MSNIVDAYNVKRMFLAALSVFSYWQSLVFIYLFIYLIIKVIVITIILVKPLRDRG